MNYRNTRESRQNLNLVEGMMKSGKSREKKTIVIVNCACTFTKGIYFLVPFGLQGSNLSKIKSKGMVYRHCRSVALCLQWNKRSPNFFPRGILFRRRGFMFSHLSKPINNFKSGYKNYTTLDNIF